MTGQDWGPDPFPAAARTDLVQAARNYLATCEPEHPVQDLLNIDSPTFGSSDLILANPARTRLHIARFCTDGRVHRFLVDALAFGCWTRDMIGVSTRVFRTSATFTLYLFAPSFPETARALLVPFSGLFQVELVPFALVRIAGRPNPVIHVLRQSSHSSAVPESPGVVLPTPPTDAIPTEDFPAGLTPEEVAEFLRLENLYFGRS